MKYIVNCYKCGNFVTSRNLVLTRDSFVATLTDFATQSMEEPLTGDIINSFKFDNIRPGRYSYFRFSRDSPYNFEIRRL